MKKNVGIFLVTFGTLFLVDPIGSYPKKYFFNKAKISDFYLVPCRTDGLRNGLKCKEHKLEVRVSGYCPGAFFEVIRYCNTKQISFLTGDYTTKAGSIMIHKYEKGCDRIPNEEPSCGVKYDVTIGDHYMYPWGAQSREEIAFDCPPDLQSFSRRSLADLFPPSNVMSDECIEHNQQKERADWWVTLWAVGLAALVLAVIIFGKRDATAKLH